MRKKRLEVQQTITNAMDLYLLFSKRTAEEIKSFKKQLGDSPYQEAVDQFSKGIVSNELRPAYSLWRMLSEHEMRRWWLRGWIDNCADRDELGEFDRRIRRIEDMVLIGKVLGKDDLEEIDRLLATSINLPDVRSISKAEELEYMEQANKWLEKIMTTSEGR